GGGQVTTGFAGTYTITSTPTPTSFTYTSPFVGLTSAGGGTASRGAVEVGNAVTITTGTAPHGLSVGDTVEISGASIGAVGIIAPGTVGATESGSTVTITTTAPHGLTAGQVISISGVNNPGYNGSFVITGTTATTFTYTAAVTGLAPSGGGQVTTGYNGTYQVTSVPTPTSFTYTLPFTGLGLSGGGAVTRGAYEQGNTVTISTTAPHGLQVGQAVVVSGVGVAGYNGTFTITSTPTPTSFTYTNPTVAATI